jgi:hypothetical protein
LTTGNQQTVQFTIVQTINGSAVLSVVPAVATISGPDTNTCSTNFRVDYYIYGGTPPYRVTSTFPSAVTLINVPVAVSGGFFTAITNGTCVNPLIFSIFDAVGLQTTAQLINQPGAAKPPAPSTLVLSGSYSGVPCNGSASYNFIVTGGTPAYNVSTTSGTVTQQPAGSGGTAVVTPAAAPTGTVVTVVVIDSGTPQQQASSTITCS